MDHIFTLEHIFPLSSFLLYIQFIFFIILIMKKIFYILVGLGFIGCAGHYDWIDDFEYKPITTQQKQIATWQKITSIKSPIHFYIEGDGHAYFANGAPTPNPTPHDSFMRDLAMRDDAENVVYVARPCQFIMDEKCDFHDWTDAKFSEQNVDSVANTIRKIANGRHVILIGYSGGAMMTGLVIKNNPDIKVKKWITIAGVLNHHDWTTYFNDAHLDKSLDLDALPNVPQIHYVGAHDSVVPITLSQQWISADKIQVLDNATHSNFPNLELDFD